MQVPMRITVSLACQLRPAIEPSGPLAFALLAQPAPLDLRRLPLAAKIPSAWLPSNFAPDFAPILVPSNWRRLLEAASWARCDLRFMFRADYFTRLASLPVERSMIVVSERRRRCRHLLGLERRPRRTHSLIRSTFAKLSACCGQIRCHHCKFRPLARCLRAGTTKLQAARLMGAAPVNGRKLIEGQAKVASAREGRRALGAHLAAQGPIRRQVSWRELNCVPARSLFAGAR